MGDVATRGRTLRATLCEVERGVFYVNYPDSPADKDELVIYQTCPSAADAKVCVESRAWARGYETIVWTQTIVAPLFASHIKTVPPEVVAAYAVRFGR